MSAVATTGKPWCMARAANVVVLVAIIGGLNACGSGQPPGDRWVEKVTLANGEVLDVSREMRYGGAELGSKGGPLTYARLEFDYKGKHYRWEEETVDPYVLEIDAQGRPTVAGDIIYEWAWDLRGRPCDRGVVQYYDVDKWVQIPSWEISTSRRSNLAPTKKDGLAGVARAEKIGAGRKIYETDITQTRCEKEKVDVQ